MSSLTRSCSLALTLACAAFGAATATNQEPQDPQPALRDLLLVVGRYVQEYERSFSAVVSREHYVQRARSGGVEEAQELRSEVALVAVGDSDWMLFRDVYQVGGRAVRDRDDRLATLFLKPTPDLGAQARRIAEESARYNLGAITRTLNTPTQALVFLRSRDQYRSAFRLGDRRTVDGVEAHELVFEERALPRVILTLDDAAATGRAWVAPDTGTVVRTELRIASAGATARIVVRYARDARLALWVPATMSESYDLVGREATTSSDIPMVDRLRAPSRVTIEARASYTDFRRFSVNTTEIIR